MTNDGTKEWKTIRIEKPVRDAASDDPRTYTEIMRDGLEGASVEFDGTDEATPLDEVFDDLDERLAERVADAVAERVDAPDTVSLEASERRAIAQEVVEVLQS